MPCTRQLRRPSKVGNNSPCMSRGFLSCFQPPLTSEQQILIECYCNPVISTFGIVPYTLWTVHPLHKTFSINSILGFPSHTTRLQKSYLIMISYSVSGKYSAHLAVSGMHRSIQRENNTNSLRNRHRTHTMWRQYLLLFHACARTHARSSWPFQEHNGRDPKEYTMHNTRKQIIRINIKNWHLFGRPVNKELNSP